MKKLNLIIKSCDECPYYKYDHHDDDSYCVHSNGDMWSSIEKNTCPLEDITIMEMPVQIEGMRSLTKEESEAYRKFLETQFKPTGNYFMPDDMSEIKLKQDTEILLRMEEQETE